MYPVLINELKKNEFKDLQAWGGGPYYNNILNIHLEP